MTEVGGNLYQRLLSDIKWIDYIYVLLNKIEIRLIVLELGS